MMVCRSMARLLGSKVGDGAWNTYLIHDDRHSFNEWVSDLGKGSSPVNIVLLRYDSSRAIEVFDVLGTVYNECRLRMTNEPRRRESVHSYMTWHFHPQSTSTLLST
jgi:hypothetical protein